MRTVKQLRYSRGLTQKQLARMLGTKPVRISNWERRKQTPSLRYAYQLSQLFGVPMEELDIARRARTETGAVGAPVTALDGVGSGITERTHGSEVDRDSD